MRCSVGMILPLILAAGLGAAPPLFAQGIESGEPPRKDLRVRDFFYRVGPGYAAGPFRIHAFASQYLLFDDNVFLTEDDTETETSLETVVGARAELPYLKHLFLAEYQLEYVNYLGDDEGEAAPDSAYGPVYTRLREVKRRYDPDNLFHLNQNIVP